MDSSEDASIKTNGFNIVHEQTFLKGKCTCESQVYPTQLQMSRYARRATMSCQTHWPFFRAGQF